VKKILVRDADLNCEMILDLIVENGSDFILFCLVH